MRNSHGIKSIKADSQQEGYEAELAVDGDPATMWHTTWGTLAAGLPHELTVEFVAPRSLAGERLLPRQDGQRNGWINEYEIYAAGDARDWGQPILRGKLSASASEQEIKFAQPVTARFLKLRALSGHVSGPWTSLAELEVIAAD